MTMMHALRALNGIVLRELYRFVHQRERFASALVRPTKSILDMEAKSVKKKWNLPHFAAGANRQVIERGAAMMGKDLDFVIEETIRGMRNVSEAIGLKGTVE